jgi:hypothetical protein
MALGDEPGNRTMSEQTPSERRRRLRTLSRGERRALTLALAAILLAPLVIFFVVLPLVNRPAPTLNISAPPEEAGRFTAIGAQFASENEGVTVTVNGPEPVDVQVSVGNGLTVVEVTESVRNRPLAEQFVDYALTIIGMR